MIESGSNPDAKRWEKHQIIGKELQRRNKFRSSFKVFCRLQTDPRPPRVEAGWETAAGRTLLHQRPEQAHFHPACPHVQPPLPGADSSVIWRTSMTIL